MTAYTNINNTNTQRTPLRIGMIGGGTVGGGVYDIVMGRLLHDDDHPPSMIITKVCVRDLSKPRSFHLVEEYTQLTNKLDDVIHDDSIQVVIEVMGGDDINVAKYVVEESIQRGKHVVTANKALVAQHLDELHQLSLSHNKILAYEAAVCGGIPIISTLHSCYTGDVIQQVSGICNGSTNYMLTRMESEGAPLEEVLRTAQGLGYAEADPTADVEGHDVRAKIAILAKLAFGTTVPLEQIPCQGISSVSCVDFEYAKLLGCTIKLVGTATRLSEYGEHDGALSVYVAPQVVANTHLLASARGSGNAVAVKSANLGTASFAGPGAGRFPTAHSVVADVARIAAGTAAIDPFPMARPPLDIDADYTSAFYIRIPFMDSLGIIRRVGELAEQHGVSIHSVLQNPIEDRMSADFCLTTESCKVSQVQALCQDVDQEDFSRSFPLCMPLLMEHP